MSCNEWRAFGNEFGKCINEINNELQRLPRKQKLAFLTQMRKAMRRNQSPRPRPPVSSSPKKRKAVTNLWAPRK